jgi:hypothetical protein
VRARVRPTLSHGMSSRNLRPEVAWLPVPPRATSWCSCAFAGQGRSGVGRGVLVGGGRWMEHSCALSRLGVAAQGHRTVRARAKARARARSRVRD